MDKVELIKKIVEEHPVYGVAYGLSEYTGGMKDSGSWDVIKMFESEDYVLQNLWDSILTDKQRPPIELDTSPKIFYKGMWITQNELSWWDMIVKDIEYKLFFGSKMS